MHLKTREIKGLGVVITVTCTTIVVLLFVRTNRSTLINSLKDLRGKSVGHRAADNLSQRQSNAIFQAQQATIQSQRLRQIQEGCKAMSAARGGLKPLQELPKDVLTQYIVDEKYRLLYCHVPKVASTSWIRIFLVLNGIFKTTTDAYHQQLVHRTAMTSLRQLSSYDAYNVQIILDTYTKFVFVRNPFTRLLSVFRNKFEHNLTNKGHRTWYGWIHHIKSHFSKAKARVYGPLEKEEITFVDFVRYVSEEAVGNNHWDSMVRICRPCHINYTFIGKLETLTTDVEYIMQLAKIDKVVAFPGPQSSSPTNSSNSKTIAAYFADVPEKVMSRLRRKFQWDLKIFGYDPPHAEHG